jgi:Zn-dependent protease
MIGFTLHEWAHSYSAYRLGDDSQLFNGRLTLDPRAHLEPVGIILAILVGFGWAKPVPVNVRAFYPNEQRSFMLVALAGPVTNLILALVAFGIPFRIFIEIGLFGINSFFFEVLETIIIFNLVLFLFNLIPLAPLDGWKILLGLLPADRSNELKRYEQESTVALMILLIAGFIHPYLNVLGTVFGPIIRFFLELITGLNYV